MARYGGCDGMYLYANDSALDFYPKFGFVRAQEYQCSLPVQKSGEPARRLDMEKTSERARLVEAYLARSNPHSLLPMLGNTGLLIFYCGQFLNTKCMKFRGWALWPSQSTTAAVCSSTTCSERTRRLRKSCPRWQRRRRRPLSSLHAAGRGGFHCRAAHR